MSDPWGDPDPGRTWRPGVGTAAQPPAGHAARDGDAPPSDAAPDGPPLAPLYPTGPPDGDWSYFAPPGEFPPEWHATPATPLLDHLKAFGYAAVGSVLLGAPLALLWRAVAPRAVVLRTAAGPQPDAPESSQVFAVDGWFVVVSLIVGVVAGTVAWLALRDRGPLVPVGLATGGLTAAFVAAAVGRFLVVDRYVYDFCNQPDLRCIIYDGTLRLYATPAVVVLPVAMLTAFAVLTMTMRDDRPEPAGPADPAEAAGPA